MNLLLIHLKRTEYLDDVLLALTQIGIYDPAVIEALGGQNRMMSGVPIFAGFMTGIGSPRSEYHRLIVAMTRDAKAVDRIIQALADGGIDWTGDGLGDVAVIPLAQLVGSR